MSKLETLPIKGYIIIDDHEEVLVIDDADNYEDAVNRLERLRAYRPLSEFTLYAKVEV